MNAGPRRVGFVQSRACDPAWRYGRPADDRIRAADCLSTKLEKTQDAPVAPVASPARAAAMSASRDAGAGLGEHEVKAILDYKKKHPSMGPA